MKISKKLKEILKNSDNIVAKNLLELEKDKSFINKIGYLSLASNDISKISYISEERLEKFQCGIAPHVWNRKLRISNAYAAKSGKVANKIFKDKIAFTQNDIYKFSLLFYKKINNEDLAKYDFRILKGEDIRNAYLEDNYYNIEKGDLGNSCMRYQSCQEYLDIYVENSNISLLVLIKEDKIFGRALLWDNVVLNGEITTKYLDRVYCNDNNMINIFEAYAENNNISYIENNTSDFILTSENRKFDDCILKVELEKTKFDYYPYLDTFRYLKDKTLFSDCDECDLKLDSTEG